MKELILTVSGAWTSSDSLRRFCNVYHCSFATVLSAAFGSTVRLPAMFPWKGLLSYTYSPPNELHQLVCACFVQILSNFNWGDSLVSMIGLYFKYTFTWIRIAPGSNLGASRDGGFSIMTGACSIPCILHKTFCDSEPRSRYSLPACVGSLILPLFHTFCESLANA